MQKYLWATSLLGATSALCLSCAMDAKDTGAGEAHIGADARALVQGTDESDLWPSRRVVYCFETPQLADMPSSVRGLVATQEQLEDRWEARMLEFVSAIDQTWNSVGVLELVAQVGCTPGAIPVRYDRDTPTGGYAAIGHQGAQAIGIQMDSEFLGDDYASGLGTYHTYVAAHEVGHTLGFRHEQDRADSTCPVSQDFVGFGVNLTGYDADSIMNYCNDQRTRLSDLDREGFIRAYSFLP